MNQNDAHVLAGFMAAAISNPQICTGHAHYIQIKEWFGEGNTNVTRNQIVVKQARDAANLMFAEYLAQIDVNQCT